MAAAAAVVVAGCRRVLHWVEALWVAASWGRLLWWYWPSSLHARSLAAPS